MQGFFCLALTLRLIGYWLGILGYLFGYRFGFCVSFGYHFRLRYRYRFGLFSLCLSIGFGLLVALISYSRKK